MKMKKKKKMKFGQKLPRSFFEISKSSKFQKSELRKFISNFSLKHVITSTNIEKLNAFLTRAKV